MKTAVEWLIGEIFEYKLNPHYENLFEQAKEMEKQVNAETWNNAIDAQLKDKWESFEQYYNETFKDKI